MLIFWVVAVLTAFALDGSSLAAEPQADRDSAGAVATIEQILRHAGASPADLTRLEEQLRRASSADLAQFVHYLQAQTPLERTRFVEEMRLNAQYVPGPDSKEQPGVPQGKTIEFELSGSRVFPGTRHKISVYVPAEYSADKPACVYVGLDARRAFVCGHAHGRAGV